MRVAVAGNPNSSAEVIKADIPFNAVSERRTGLYGPSRFPSLPPIPGFVASAHPCMPIPACKTHTAVLLLAWNPTRA